MVLLLFGEHKLLWNLSLIQSINQMFFKNEKYGKNLYLLDYCQ